LGMAQLAVPFLRMTGFRTLALSLASVSLALPLFSSAVHAQDSFSPSEKVRMRGLLAISSSRELIHKGDIVVIPMHGEIGPSLFFFLRRGIKLAEAGQAGAVILDMNTYGGRLDSAEEITG